MQSLTAAQTLAQRSSACLARRATSANSRSRALLVSATASSSSVLSPSSFCSSPSASVQTRTASSFHGSSRAAVAVVAAAAAPPPPPPLWAVSPPLPAALSSSSSCHHPQRRCFSQTAVRPKKGGGKKDKKEKTKGGGGGGGGGAASSVKEDTAGGDEDGSSGHVQADPNDPFNWADVETRWDRTDAHHQDKFKELRRSFGGGDGGAVDIEAIGRTPVKGGGGDDPNHPDQKDSSTTPLAQLALIIPRGGGRVVELRMHSAASRKAIVSAVQAHPLFRGQQPQPDPDDELVLLIKMGGEKAGSGSAEAVVAERTRRVRDLANAWRDQIRKTTARRQKAHQTWKKSKQVSRADDLQLLDRDLLKKQQQRMAGIDEAEKKLLADLQKGGR